MSWEPFESIPVMEGYGFFAESLDPAFMAFKSEFMAEMKIAHADPAEAR